MEIPSERLVAPMIGEMLAGKYTETSACRSALLANSFALSCEQEGIEIALQSHAKTLARFCNKSPEVVHERLLEAAEATKKSLKKFDINIALQLLLEGLSRGAGFNCCLIGLLNPQRSRLFAKHVIERSNSQVKQSFDFNCATQIPEIQQSVLINRNIILLHELREKGKTQREIIKQLHNSGSSLGALLVENKAIGCLYADNGDSGQALSAEQFKLFVYQARSHLHSLKGG
jgi:hypothetical protein